MPKTSEAMRRAIDKYNKEKCDEIKLRTPKGKKEVISKFAKEHGNKSLNGFINEAIDEKIERESHDG